jgi:hypothetical protein
MDVWRLCMCVFPCLCTGRGLRRADHPPKESYREFHGSRPRPKLGL